MGLINWLYQKQKTRLEKMSYRQLAEAPMYEASSTFLGGAMMIVVGMGLVSLSVIASLATIMSQKIPEKYADAISQIINLTASFQMTLWTSIGILVIVDVVWWIIQERIRRKWEKEWEKKNKETEG